MAKLELKGLSSPFFLFPSANHRCKRLPLNPVSTTFATQSIRSQILIGTQKLVHQFDPEIPIEKAVTPPSSWYTDHSFFALELDRVFFRGWQASINRVVSCCYSCLSGYLEQIKNPHDFFTGRLGKVEFVVCRDDDGAIHAFHNVCRHHAMILASGSGKKSCFVCPYHGWTYGLDGQLIKVSRITGIKNFHLKEFGLIPLQVGVWGPFVLLNVNKEGIAHEVSQEWLGSCSDVLSMNGVDASLTYICRREYIIECNWKVFCDNYLDGGYHVPYAHKGLSSGLKLDSYSTDIFDRGSIQRCEGGSLLEDSDYGRLGSKALYAFIYPNFMINRYGPWMDTNLVLPLGPRKCQVVFDYFLEDSLKDDRNVVQDDKTFIESSLKDSERVQLEDIALCEGVQRGLESPAYESGRYAPSVENAMHHFHCQLHASLT